MGYTDPDERKRYAQQHYAANKALYIARAKVSKKKGRIKNRHLLLEYLLGHPCVDCGEADPVVLQFDHVNDDKTEDVGRMLSWAVSWKRILQEIAKCEVVCANCHARRTAKRHGGWFKSLGRVAEQEDAPASSTGA